MIKVFSLLSLPIKLQQQATQITRLQRQVALLEQKNLSMREGMRRCITCEYRIDHIKRSQ